MGVEELYGSSFCELGEGEVLEIKRACTYAYFNTYQKIQTNFQQLHQPGH